MKIIEWVKAHKIESVLIAVLLLVAIFFRFYKIADYVVFLGDEGRDMLVMKRMIMDGKIPFIGPTASVGGFYLGPIYYWMAAPFLALWRLNPVGPAYMVAIFGVATVLVLYKFLRDTVGLWPALLASLLYAVNPLIVRYSRSSWNPNPIPFFALSLIYLIYLYIIKKKLLFIFLAGVCFGILVQLHYLTIVMGLVAALIVALNFNYKKWPKILLVSIAGFLVTFSPFLLFEIKNHFPNFITIHEFVTRGTTVGYKTYNYVYLISSYGDFFLSELTKIHGQLITKIIFWAITVASFIGLYVNRKNEKTKRLFTIGIIWFLGGLAGLRLYRGQMFDYYFGFLYPAPFFLLGLIFSLFWKNHIYKIIVCVVVVAAGTWFLVNGFYRSIPNRLLKQTESVADVVIDKSEGKPFNFALISDHNSDHAYRYFLEIKGHTPTELETLVTEQLLVVCESKKCSPHGHPTWEIAGFGRGDITGEWELPTIGIKVIRLKHWDGAPSPAGKPAVKG